MREFHYDCSTCGKSFRPEEVRYLCPDCGKDFAPGMPLRGVLLAIFDYPEITRRFRVEAPDWTLFSAVHPRHYPPYPVGNTPFFKCERLGRELGLPDVWIKNDGQNPSASLKDRASFLMVAEANRLGERVVVTASTGNAACALAAACAPADKSALIFVPEIAPRAKLAQMLLYGARVVPLKGTYDDAFRLSFEYTARNGGLNRNTAYHPLTIEGKKTVGFEIFEQNQMRVPEVIVVPVGDGVILAGVWKAFYDLRAAGLISRLPRLVCVQAEKSSAIHDYFRTGKYQPAPNPVTVADSISVSVPSNAHLARRALLESEGTSVLVSDEQILRAQKLLAETTGIFAEPAAAAAVAALEELARDKTLEPAGRIVVLITGHGLKDIDPVLRQIPTPPSVEPNLEQVEAALHDTRAMSLKSQPLILNSRHG